MATCEIQERCLDRGSGHSPIVISLGAKLFASASHIVWALLAPKAQPDEIEGPAHAYQEADEGEVGGVEEVVCRPTSPAPEE